MSDLFVIWTRYAKPDTNDVVRHVFGTYETRSKARTELNLMLLDHEQHFGNLHGVEYKVTKLIQEPLGRSGS